MKRSSLDSHWDRCIEPKKAGESPVSASEENMTPDTQERFEELRMEIRALRKDVGILLAESTNDAAVDYLASKIVAACDKMRRRCTNVLHKSIDEIPNLAQEIRTECD